MKYDFGENISEGSTMDWAKNIVCCNSKVLELGPAVGTLTKYLSLEKRCDVDIVEIDEESGKIAKQYSNNACLGNVEGNLELDDWKKRINEINSYDYVIMLDVIEHIRNPHNVLAYIKSLLKEDGEILLSTPNISHNAIIINLLNDEFKYNPLGILDETHVKLYTEKSIQRLVKESGLYIYDIKYIQKVAEETEFKANYSMVPIEIESFLRQRDNADVYQFMLRITKKENEKKCNNHELLYYTKYPAQVFDGDSNLLFEYRINPKEEVCLEIDLRNTNTKYIRIDPIDKSGIISNLKLQWRDDNDVIQNRISDSNGIRITPSTIAFLTDDPQVIIKNRGKILMVSYNYNIVSEQILKLLFPMC